LTLEQNDFISKCLAVVPEERHSARRLLLHGWIFNSKRSSNTSSDMKEDVENSSSSSEDEDDISVSFSIHSSKDQKYVIDHIKEELSKNQWKMKDQSSLELIKVSKKSDSGFNMINIILHDSTNGILNIDIKNGSAMKMATLESKNELKNIILNLEY